MTMTIEEAKKMVGTEFIYVFEDGDTIPAYVKTFDPIEKGLTCYTLETKTSRGWEKREHDDSDMPDGTFCVIGGDIETFGIDHFLQKLEEIRDTGQYTQKPSMSEHGVFAGCAF